MGCVCVCVSMHAWISCTRLFCIVLIEYLYVEYLKSKWVVPTRFCWICCNSTLRNSLGESEVYSCNAWNCVFFRVSQVLVCLCWVTLPCLPMSPSLTTPCVVVCICVCVWWEDMWKMYSWYVIARDQSSPHSLGGHKELPTHCLVQSPLLPSWCKGLPTHVWCEGSYLFIVQRPCYLPHGTKAPTYFILQGPAYSMCGTLDGRRTSLLYV